MDIKLMDIVGLLEFFRKRHDDTEGKRTEAVVATHRAVRETRSYFEHISKGQVVPDKAKEKELSDLWMKAGSLMLVVNRDTANWLFQKSQYWNEAAYYELSGQGDLIPTLEQVERELAKLTTGR